VSTFVAAAAAAGVEAGGTGGEAGGCDSAAVAVVSDAGGVLATRWQAAQTAAATHRNRSVMG